MNYFIIVFFVLSSIFYSSFLSGGDQALINVNIEQSFVKRNSQLIRNLVLAVGGGSLLICRRTKILSNLIDFSAGQSIVMDLFGVGFMATAINRAVLEGCKIELNSNVSLASGVASGLTAMVLQMESLGFDLSNPLTQKHSFLGSLLICKLIIMAELIYGCRRNQKTIGNKSQQLLDKNSDIEELKLVQEKCNGENFLVINNMRQQIDRMRTEYEQKLRRMRTEHERNIKTLKVKLGERNMIILYIYFYLNRVGREKTQMEKQHRTDMELALEEHRTDMELALEEHKKRTA